MAVRFYRPVDIARELNISTSALRHYEAWGIVPEPPRDANGYRRYTDEHLAYFRALRALIAGFGYPAAYQILHHIRHGERNEAFWLVSREQARIHEQKTAAEQTLALLQLSALPPNLGKVKERMTIGEVSGITRVPPSAIRHWEKEGLIRPDRDPDNGYRLYRPVHVRQILLISTLRRTVFYLDRMKPLVEQLEQQNLNQLKKVTETALNRIHEQNRKQMQGIHQLVNLCHEVGLLDGDAAPNLTATPYSKVRK